MQNSSGPNSGLRHSGGRVSRARQIVVHDCHISEGRYAARRVCVDFLSLGVPSAGTMLFRSAEFG